MKLITLIRTEDDEPFYEAYTYKFKYKKGKLKSIIGTDSMVPDIEIVKLGKGNRIIQVKSYPMDDKEIITWKYDSKKRVIIYKEDISGDALKVEFKRDKKGYIKKVIEGKKKTTIKNTMKSGKVKKNAWKAVDGKTISKSYKYKKIKKKYLKIVKSQQQDLLYTLLNDLIYGDDPINYIYYSASPYIVGDFTIVMV